MNEAEQKELKVKIKKKIKRLEVNIIDLKEATKPISPENAIGRISRMDAINNKSVNEAALRAAEVKLTKLQAALSKVGSDNFGICTLCKEPIQAGRIVIAPESPFCIKCASKR